MTTKRERMEADLERLEDARRALINRLWTEERLAFKLTPDEVPPLFCGGDPPTPDDATAWGLTWPRGRRLRDELLHGDPDRYVEFEALCAKIDALEHRLGDRARPRHPA